MRMLDRAPGRVRAREGNSTLFEGSVKTNRERVSMLTTGGRSVGKPSHVSRESPQNGLNAGEPKRGCASSCISG